MSVWSRIDSDQNLGSFGSHGWEKYTVMCGMRQSNVNVTRGTKHMTGMLACMTRVAKKATAASRSEVEVVMRVYCRRCGAAVRGLTTGVVVIVHTQRELRTGSLTRAEIYGEIDGSH